jgi:hypothetical protein
VPLAVQACGGVAEEQGHAPRVRVERAAGRATVKLQQPREPLAWAVDGAFDASRPFRAAWHSERTPGARARPAAREAMLERAPGPLGVRVWYDDGRAGTIVVGA